MMNKKSGKTLYLECCSGISGDMTVGALLDLGADENILLEVLESLPVKGFRVQISRVKKAGLDVCDFNVILDGEHENHDHNMEYLHGHEHAQTREHHHSHGHTQDPGQGDVHEHVHEHRGLKEVLYIIEHAQMTPKSKEISIRIFNILAEAEAQAHGVPAEEVHFHEVGAVDSIVDIISAAVCLDNLGIEECIVTELCEGCGTIRCQHGILPVPVPAVANIAADNHLNLTITECHGELVTPTGAAIAAAVRTSGRLPASFSIQKIGMGGGKREYERPGILRAMLIEGKELSAEADCIWKLESNIDDCTGEELGYVMERLLDQGARDVNYTPVYMKKNRPAYQLNVICSEEDMGKLEEIIFQETTTIGIRKQRMERSILKRNIKTVMTSLGEAQVKVCTLDSGNRTYPEYKSVAALCKRHGMPYREVYQLIVRECT